MTRIWFPNEPNGNQYRQRQQLAIGVNILDEPVVFVAENYYRRYLGDPLTIETDGTFTAPDVENHEFEDYFRRYLGDPDA